MTREEALRRLEDGGPAIVVKYRNKKGLTRYGRIVEVLNKWAVVESGDYHDEYVPPVRKRIKIAELEPFHKDV